MSEQKKIGPKKISELMKEYGFKEDAPESTAKAFIQNLVRSAYGPNEAREFFRQINLKSNRDDRVASEAGLFNKTNETVDKLTEEKRIQKTDEPEQLTLFKGTGTD